MTGPCPCFYTEIIPCNRFDSCSNFRVEARAWPGHPLPILANGLRERPRSFECQKVWQISFFKLLDGSMPLVAIAFVKNRERLFWNGDRHELFITQQTS